MEAAAQEEVKGGESADVAAENLPVILRQKPLAKQVHAAESTHIPAMFLVNQTSSKLLIYFHGNAEDLALAEQ